MILEYISVELKKAIFKVTAENVWKFNGEYYDGDYWLADTDNTVTGIVLGVPVFVEFETASNYISAISLNGVSQTLSSPIVLGLVVGNEHRG